MYPNLNAEMSRYNISNKDIATPIGRTESTASLELNGKYPITLDEAKKIKAIIPTNKPLEVLFSTEAID
jgi:antitoxin component HigA of HigAB toxin-antitoxin module